MNKFKILFYSLSFLVAVILITYGLNVFPVPGTDSIVFIPPALLFSKGFGLANPLYYVTQFTDPTQTNRFNYYVPFYPFLLGLLSKVWPGIKTIFFFCSIFSTAGLLLYARFVTSFLNEKTGPWLKFLVLLSVTYAATYLLPTVGRPENLTVLLVFLVYLLYRNRLTNKGAIYNVAICALFSAILATQLICFYFCFLFFISYEILSSKNIYRSIAINSIRFIFILAGFCIILALSPNGFTNTITGIRTHAAFALTRHDTGLSLFIHYWLLAPLNFGFIFLFILAVVAYIKEIYFRSVTGTLLSKIAMIIIQLLIGFGFVKFILYGAATVYNGTQFILPLSAFVISSMVTFAKGNRNRYFIPVALLTYLTGSVIFLRSIVLFINYKMDGKDYDHARPLANSIAQKYPGLYVTNSLWSLFDDPNEIKIFSETNFKKGDVIMVQQVNHPFPRELVNKCTIIYDWRTADNSELSGIKLAHRPQGYGFILCKVN